MIAKSNLNVLAKLIGKQFNFQHFFPSRQRVSFEELLALAGALYAYFSQATKDLHKAAAYAISITLYKFYAPNNKQKAKEILLLSVQLMLSEISRRNNLEYEMNESPLSVSE